jgi:transposase-like protein
MEPRVSNGAEEAEDRDAPFIKSDNRREYKEWFKAQVVEECHAPGNSVSIIARRHGPRSCWSRSAHCSGSRKRSKAKLPAIRQQQSVPALHAIKACFEATLSQISNNGSLATAIHYTTSRWPSMTHFIEDGRLELSNNPAERTMRPIAVGRNNWTFAGSDGGGERDIIYTLIESTKMNDLDPEAYLRSVISPIGDPRHIG